MEVMRPATWQGRENLQGRWHNIAALLSSLQSHREQILKVFTQNEIKDIWGFSPA